MAGTHTVVMGAAGMAPESHTRWPTRTGARRLRENQCLRLHEKRQAHDTLVVIVHEMWLPLGGMMVIPHLEALLLKDAQREARSLTRQQAQPRWL